MPHDAIERTIVLKAPLERARQAISGPAQFGAWFGIAIEGPFVAGRTTIRPIVPTRVDPDVARRQEPYRGTAVDLAVEEIEPMRRFAFRWHPFAIEPSREYADEPPTLVAFLLQPIGDETRLTITESGFDRLPPDRGAVARRANAGGWAHQTRLIARYLAMRGTDPAP